MSRCRQSPRCISKEVPVPLPSSLRLSLPNSRLVLLFKEDWFLWYVQSFFPTFGESPVFWTARVLLYLTCSALLLALGHGRIRTRTAPGPVRGCDGKPVRLTVNHFCGNRRGIHYPSQTDDQKGLWISDLRSRRNRSVSRTRKPT